MDFVTVYSTLNPADADLIRSRLESAGFVVNMRYEDAGMGIEITDLLVQVPAERAEDARALVAYRDPLTP
jgi:hypothetical protein